MWAQDTLVPILTFNLVHVYLFNLPECISEVEDKSDNSSADACTFCNDSNNSALCQKKEQLFYSLICKLSRCLLLFVRPLAFCFGRKKRSNRE